MVLAFASAVMEFIHQPDVVPVPMAAVHGEEPVAPVSVFVARLPAPPDNASGQDVKSVDDAIDSIQKNIDIPLGSSMMDTAVQNN
jgi:hypothetical protein